MLISMAPVLFKSNCVTLFKQIVSLLFQTATVLLKNIFAFLLWDYGNYCFWPVG